MDLGGHRMITNHRTFRPKGRGYLALFDYSRLAPLQDSGFAINTRGARLIKLRVEELISNDCHITTVPQTYPQGYLQ